MKTRNLINLKTLVVTVSLSILNQGCYQGCEHHNIIGDALNAFSDPSLESSHAGDVMQPVGSQRVIDLEDGNPKAVYSKLLSGGMMKRSDNNCEYWVSTDLDLEPLRKRLSDLGKSLKEVSGDEIRVGEKISTTFRLSIQSRSGQNVAECGLGQQVYNYVPVVYTATVEIEVTKFQKQEKSRKAFTVPNLDAVTDFVLQAKVSADFENTLVGHFHYDDNFKLSIVNQILSSTTSGDCS